MTELIISEITIMDRGFCVIGLERDGDRLFSVRPLPPRGNAWRHFPYKRGDILCFRLFPVQSSGPHVEDRSSTAILGKVGEVSERDLVQFLRKAEVAQARRQLFGCDLRESPMGGEAVWVDPSEAQRSISGCDFRDIQFGFEYGRCKIALSFSWGDIFRALPLVDRDWNDFVQIALARLGGLSRHHRVIGFLNAGVRARIVGNPNRFARIGIARPKQGRCWSMLDSLFPLPQGEWLTDLLGDSAGGHQE